MSPHEKTQAQIEILKIVRDNAWRTCTTYRDADEYVVKAVRSMNNYAAHLCDSYIEDLRGDLTHQQEEA